MNLSEHIIRIAKELFEKSGARPWRHPREQTSVIFERVEPEPPYSDDKIGDDTKLFK